MISKQNNRRLFIMMGTPGSGKTTVAKGLIQTMKERYPVVDTSYISRDQIRFGLLKDGDAYFSKEKEVFKNFIQNIKQDLNKNKDVFVDATHLNKKSRNKLLSAIGKKSYTELYVIWVHVPLSVALERNKKRAGTRSFVPEDAVIHMNNSIEPPQFDEGFNKIFIVDEKGSLEIKERSL